VAVAATVLTVAKVLAANTAADARSVTAGLPLQRAYENVRMEPVSGTTYVEEHYIPGPGAQQIESSQTGKLELRPQYLLKVFTPANIGGAAAYKYADALLSLFEPGTDIEMENGDLLRVRTDVGPYPGTLSQAKPGWCVVPVTVPFWIHTRRGVA
jgi:hypothetical protein